MSFIDTKISLATIVSWITGLIGTILLLSSLYGETKQKVTNLESQQVRLERTLERMEGKIDIQGESIIRLESEWRGRISPKQTK